MSTYDRLANRLAGAWGSLQQPQDQHRGWNASLAGSGDHPSLSPSSSGTTPKIYSPPSTGTGPVTPSQPLLPASPEFTVSGGPAPYTGPSPFGGDHTTGSGVALPAGPGGGGGYSPGGSPSDGTANNQSSGWTPTGPDWAPGNPGYVGAKNNPWGGGVSLYGPPDQTLTQMEYGAHQAQQPFQPYTGPGASPSALGGGNPYVKDPSQPYSQANSIPDAYYAGMGMPAGQTMSPGDFVNMLAQAGAYIAPDVMANPGILSGSGMVR